VALSTSVVDRDEITQIEYFAVMGWEPSYFLRKSRSPGGRCYLVQSSGVLQPQEYAGRSCSLLWIWHLWNRSGRLAFGLGGCRWGAEGKRPYRLGGCRWGAEGKRPYRLGGCRWGAEGKRPYRLGGCRWGAEGKRPYRLGGCRWGAEGKRSYRLGGCRWGWHESY